MRTPALLIALCLALGIVLGDRWPVALPLAALPLLLLGATLLAGNTPRALLWAWPICYGYFLIHLDTQTQRQLDAIRPTQGPTWVELEGRVFARPSAQAELPDHYGVVTDRLVLLQQARSLTCRNLRFKLILRNPPSVSGHYKLAGQWLPAARVLNPHQVDLELNQRRQGWTGTLEVHHWELLEAQAPTWSEQAQHLAKRVRLWISAQLTRGLPGSTSAEASLILAMILGTFPTDHTELQDDFAHSGTLHLFSVSGLHVAIVAWIATRSFKPFPYQNSWSPFVTILLCFTYAFLTGWSAASVRAAVMIAVVLLSKRLAMRSSLLNNLGIAALVLLIFKPQELFQPGFQLSFAVMLGLGWSSETGSPWIQRFLAPDAFLPRSFLNAQQRRYWAWRTHFAQLAISSTAALVASTPLTLHYFNLVTPVSLLANFILIPLSFAVLWIGCLSLLSASLGWESGQVLFNHANVAVSHLCLKSAKGFAELPYAYFYPKSSTSDSMLRVLSLPRGEIALHLHHAGQDWLIEVGSQKSYPYLLKPYLRGEGVTQLQAVLCSHRDQAHAGAFEAVSSNFQVLPSSARVLEGLWHKRQFQSRDQRLTLEELTPAWITRHVDDACSIYRITINDWTFLYLADAGFLTEDRLIQNSSTSWLNCHILIRAQHRSDLSLSNTTLARVHPQLLVTTHSEQVLGEALPLHIREKCRMMRVPIWNLGSQGCVTFRVNENHLFSEDLLFSERIDPRKK